MDGTIARSDVKGGRGWLSFGRKTTDPVRPPTEKDIVGPEGKVMTDNRILEWYFRRQHRLDVHPITTDSFLDKSKDQYNAAWLCRELIQNWVDHNPSARGTLDGVEFVEEPLADGKVKFTIIGHWPFKDVTGVINPHSEKPTEGQSAGGNGIGLKQAAIRLMRDFGVDQFKVNGEHWSVDYKMVEKNAVNADLDALYAAAGKIVPHHVRHDWLVASLEDTDNTGKCSYTITTDNPELIAMLRQMRDIGVSVNNPYLKEPDFQNDKGAIKWLPLTDARAEQPSRGRLFMNGQAFNYDHNGSTPQDYWVGPEFLSLRLNNVHYAMNIDRPPLTASTLDIYAGRLVDAMTPADCVQQLFKSEHLWSRFTDRPYDSKRLGCNVIIRRIVQKLRWDHTVEGKAAQTRMADYFHTKKYLASERVTDDQANQLKADGYTICSSYFADIGMEKATTKISTKEAAVNNLANIFTVQVAQERAATEYGFQADFEAVQPATPAELFRLIKTRLAERLTNWEEVADKPGTFRLSLNVAWPREVLSHPLTKATKPEQQLLRFVRGVAQYGLAHQVYVDGRIFISQGEFVSTFIVQPDTVTGESMLYSKNVKSAQAGGTVVEFSLPPELAAQCRSALSGNATEPVADQRTQTVAAPATGDRVAAAGKSLEAVPVTQPESTAKGREVKVVGTAEPVPAINEERIRKYAAALPELRRTVAELEATAAKNQVGTLSASATPVEKYLHWRASADFYGAASKDAGYLTGRNLLDILDEHTQADVAVAVADSGSALHPVEQEFQNLNTRLKAIINGLSREHQIDHFEIVSNPDVEELAQIALLRNYLHLATGAAVPNDFFLYAGTGSYGVNIARKAIGLNAALMKVNFSEAVSVATHELAHNASMDHGSAFMLTMQSLFVASESRHRGIIKKLSAGEVLSPEEQMLVDIEDQWDSLRRSA